MRRTFAHIVLARLHIVLRIQVTRTTRKHLRLEQLPAHRRDRTTPMALRHTGQILAFAGADTSPTDTPRIPETPHGRTVILAVARNQIVSPHAIVVAAQATQAAVLEAGRRRRDLQKIVAVPQQLHAESGAHVNAVGRIGDSQPIRTGRCRVRRQNAGTVDFDTHLLAEIDLCGAQSQRNGFRPGRRSGVAIFVGDTYGERIVGTVAG